MTYLIVHKLSRLYLDDRNLFGPLNKAKIFDMDRPSVFETKNLIAKFGSDIAVFPEKFISDFDMFLHRENFKILYMEFVHEQDEDSEFAKSLKCHILNPDWKFAVLDENITRSHDNFLIEPNLALYKSKPDISSWDLVAARRRAKDLEISDLYIRLHADGLYSLD